MWPPFKKQTPGASTDQIKFLFIYNKTCVVVSAASAYLGNNAILKDKNKLYQRHTKKKKKTLKY